MSSQLMQEDVIFRLAEDAGFDDRLLANYGHLTATPHALAKFAHLIQQRQGEALAIGEVRDNGVVWFGPNPHDEIAHPLGTKFYTSPVDASQLVAQVLETAYCIVRDEVHFKVGQQSPHRFMAKDAMDKIRALIDRPVEPVIKDSLTTESGKLVPLNADSRMLDAAVAFALNVQIGGEYTWSHYMADLYRRFLEFAPTSQESRQVEQSGDELVDAVDAALVDIKEARAEANELYIQTENEECSSIAGVLATRVMGIEKSLILALANRRGGE